MKSMTSIHTIAAFLLMFILATPATLRANDSAAAPAATLEAGNSQDDLNALINAAAGDDVLISKVSSMMSAPVIVTAADLVTKIYGAIDIPSATSDKNVSQKEQILKAGRAMRLNPEEDETGVWLESAAGYRVSYDGMTPDVSAVAEFDDDHLSSFGYFFFFPYAAGQRDKANLSQCAFCGSLLQEMYDMGSIVGVPADEDGIEDPLFTALGSYDGNHINVSLREQRKPDASGRFLLVVEVTPDVYNLYDSVMAMEK